MRGGGGGRGVCVRTRGGGLDLVANLEAHRTQDLGGAHRGPRRPCILAGHTRGGTRGQGAGRGGQ